ncbi:hypothetical protein BCEN4_540007 [Burkholderia cenocepacia]|nr:hypothetical protein BCEN4_540007 [Burkholderia cenocepacia]
MTYAKIHSSRKRFRTQTVIQNLLPGG